MAELSKDTQAILGSLKAEQAAVQENNEIQRDVGTKLERFGGMFSAIKQSMADTQDSMARQTALANDAAERSKQEAAFAKVNDGNEKSTIKQLSEIMNEGFGSIKSGFDGIKSGFANLKSGVATGAGLLQKLAFGAAGLFVGYNLVKGFLDETTNGGFSRMEESIRNIDWEGVKQSASTFSSALLNVSTYLDNFPDVLLGLVGVGITNAFVRGTAAGAAGSLMSTLLNRPGGPGGPGPRRGLSPAIRRLGIAGVVAGGIATLTYMYGDEAANWINEQVGNGGNGENGGSGINWGEKVVSGVSTIAQAATLGAMFGPPGIIAGAALGTAYVLGSEVYDWMERNKELARLKLAKDLAIARAYLDSNVSEAEEITDNIDSLVEELSLDQTGDTYDRMQKEIENRTGLTADQADAIFHEIVDRNPDFDFRSNIEYLQAQVDQQRSVMQPESILRAASLDALQDEQRAFNAYLIENGRADEVVRIALSRFEQQKRREDALKRASLAGTMGQGVTFNYTPVITKADRIQQKWENYSPTGYIETNTFGGMPAWAGQNTKSNGRAN